jgi:hypothetical protein
MQILNRLGNENLFGSGSAGVRYKNISDFGKNNINAGISDHQQSWGYEDGP